MTSSPPNNGIGEVGAFGEIVLRGVSVSFGENVAVRDVTLAVEPGESLAVIGASGAGKSTLFRAITRDVAFEGEVMVGGRSLRSLSRRELKETRRGIGKIHQSYNLVPQLPAGMNVALGEIGAMGALKSARSFLVGPDASLSKRVEGAMERVGLDELSAARTSDLSGGQQQRVAVARLLVQSPDLILADEPFAAIDPVTTERVLEALRELNGAGSTLIASLHDVELAKRFPRIVALKAGGVVYDGPPNLLEDEKLSDIYAVDEKRGAKDSEDPEKPDILWKVRGRDGIGAH